MNQNQQNRKRKYPKSEPIFQQKDDVMPFKPSFWRYTKSLIVSNDKSLENIDEILKCLRTLKCRDSAKGRLALDATYELFLASYALMTTDHNTVYGKEILIRILGTTINRAVNHFQDMMSALEDKPSVTIRDTMQYFKVDKEIADFRNDFAHGKNMERTIEKDCDGFVSNLMSTKCVIIDDIHRNVLSYCPETIDDFIPPAYLIVAMKSIFNLISEKGCIFTLARYTAECAANDCPTKPQYMYWTSWIIKRIAKDDIVSNWEITELYKISLALNLDDCIIEIKRNFPEEIREYENLVNDNNSSMMYFFEHKPWGSL
uniref:DUF4145 domain-containing protein n=1 Tax=Parastrongyloides trichosuri TaxID=131310 RepID=A0A0N5A1F2_PARTI